MPTRRWSCTSVFAFKGCDTAHWATARTRSCTLATGTAMHGKCCNAHVWADQRLYLFASTRSALLGPIEVICREGNVETGVRGWHCVIANGAVHDPGHRDSLLPAGRGCLAEALLADSVNMTKGVSRGCLNRAEQSVARSRDLLVETSIFNCFTWCRICVARDTVPDPRISSTVLWTMNTQWGRTW